MELDWGGGCSFCFLFFLGREKSKNFVLLHLKEWCDKEWHGVCPSLPNPWLVWSPDKKLGTESEGVVFQAEFKRFWAQTWGGRPALCLITEVTSSTPRHRLMVGPNSGSHGFWHKESLCKDIGLFKKNWEDWRPDSTSISQRSLDRGQYRVLPELSSWSWLLLTPPTLDLTNMATNLWWEQPANVLLPPKMHSPGRNICLVKPRSRAWFFLPGMRRQVCPISVASLAETGLCLPYTMVGVPLWGWCFYRVWPKESKCPRHNLEVTWRGSGDKKNVKHLAQSLEHKVGWWISAMTIIIIFIIILVIITNEP